MARKKTAIDPIRRDRLISLLHENNLTHKEFAANVNYSLSHVDAMLAGNRAITDLAVQDFSKYFNVRAEWLANYDDYRTNEEFRIALRNYSKKEKHVLTCFNDVVQLISDIGYDISNDEHGNTVITNSFSEDITVPNDIYQSMLDDVCCYVEYKLSRIYARTK